MRLRTRVLSFMLAGSMMLSATPVSAFAGTPVLGEGAVSPTALSETNSTGTLAFDQYGYPYDSTKGNEYETNHNTTEVVSSDGSWAYRKFTNSQGDVYILALAATFRQDLTGQIINCQVISNAPTLTGGTYNGTVQLGSTNQKSDASGCTFNAPIAVLAAGATLTGCTANSSVQCAAADITLTGCTINRKSDDSTVLWLSKYDDSNTAAGCSMTLNNCNVSCGVLVSADGKATINGGTYNIPGEKMGIVANGTVHITGGEFTTQIVASTKGSITIESGTFNLGDKKFISAAGGDITIEDGTFDSYLQAQTGSLTIKGGTFTGMIGALNGNITIENGTFTGQTLALSASAPKYTGVLNITGGVFAKEPQGATGSIYKLSAEGASINGMESPVYIANQTAVPHIEMTYPANSEHKVIAWRFDIDNSNNQHGNSDATDPRAAVLLAQANYQNSADNRTIRFDCVPSIKYNGYTMGALNADTVFSPVLDVLPSELTFHAATENGPASVELGADMPADRIDISCFYTNVATNEVSEEYPTEAGTYQISVILKAKGLSDELKNNIYQNRVEWNGAYHQLSYANESTGNTLTSLTSENWRFQISTNTVTLTVDENGAPVIPADAKGVRYEGNTLTIDANTTAQFAQDSTVKCDIVNNGTLDGGLFTGTVTNHGVIESGLFVNKPENAASAKFSFTSGAAFCGLKDPSGITSLYAVRTENGQNLHLTASYSNPNRDPFGWVQAIDIPNTTESAYLLYKNPDPNLNPWTVDVWADSALSKEETDVATTFTPVACMKSSDLSIDSTGKIDISIPEVEATGVTYTNKATKETFTSYPTVAGDYVAHVSLKCIRDWNSLASKDPVIPASALLADDGVAALSEEQENQIYRVALKGDLYYFVPETLDVKVTVEQSTPASSVVNLTVDENGAPVIPADAKGVRYEGNTLTIDANTTAQFAQGSTVKCDIVNNGTLDGGLFTGTVTGSGSIARGLFLNKPEAALTTMMLSVPENASLNGFTKPDASGLTTLYAVNTLDGEGYPLLFIGDYIGTDPHTFYGWDLVYSLGGEEKNSGVDYIGQTHFEQPLYGPIPDGQNGVNCTFLPVLEMDASDLTITADKTESKINGAVIDSVQYVDLSAPDAAPSTVYPTKAGSYKAIVTLTCPGDSTYSKARVARTGHLCYHVPETLEVSFEVKFQPELSIVNGLPDTTGMEADAEGVYTSSNWTYNKNTNTLSVTNSSYFETFTGLVSCKVVAGEGVKISNGYFMDTVTFDGGTVDGGWFAKEPEGCAPSDVHSIAYADGTTEFTVNKTLTVAKIWYGGTLDINISTETPIYSVSDKYLPHQTTSLTYRTQYPRDYVLNSLPAPVLSTFTLSGVTDAYVMLDTTYRLDMTDPQDLHEGVQVTVKADACDADHQVEWVATGLELSEEQKHSAELTFTMPGNAVTLTATYPSIQPVQPELPDTDGNGNVVIPDGKTEVKGDGWTAKKDDEGKTTVEITDSKDFKDTTLNCNQITIGSNTTVSNITTKTAVTVEAGGTIASGTFSGDVSGTGTIQGGTFSGKVTSAGEIKGGTFEKDVTTTGTITDGTFNGDVSGTGTIAGGTFTGVIDDDVTITGGTFAGDVHSTNVTGGVFAGEIPATVTSTKVTATGGASINNIQKNEGADQETAVQVVGEQKLSLAYTPDGDHTFYGWQKDAEIIKKGEDTNNTNVTVGSNNPAPVYTPVVKLIRSDLNDFDLMEVAGTEGYYQVVDGELTGDCLGNELPTEPGTYALGVKLMTAEPTENTIALALYADETASVGNSVRMKDGVGYYVPEVLQVGDSIPVGGSDAATGSGDSGAGGAAVAVIGGAAIGGAAYLIGTQVYLTSVLPEGASIPTNRQQLADLLWTAAGKPQPASTALFTDISADAADSQKAARWCVEQGLLKDTGSTFKPDNYTFRPQVIKAWNDLQAKLNPQK